MLFLCYCFMICLSLLLPVNSNSLSLLRLREHPLLHSCTIIEEQTAKWLQGQSDIVWSHSCVSVVSQVSSCFLAQFPDCLPSHSNTFHLLFVLIFYLWKSISAKLFTYHEAKYSDTGLCALPFPRQRPKVLVVTQLHLGPKLTLDFYLLFYL